MTSATVDAAPKQGLVLRVLVLHSLLVPAVLTGVSTTAVVVAAVTYVVRIFGVTAGYHRLFSHHAFQTSRAFAFVLAVLGASSGQRGPLWWAAIHRRHHRTADTVDDVHSPRHKGLLFAHIGWILDKQNLKTRIDEVKDWSAYPELVWLDRFHLVAPVLLIAVLAILGAVLQHTLPALQTSAAQLVAWGFVVSTIVGIHCTSFVNSLSHRFGRRPFVTDDDSGNIWWLALPTMGEAWHNNHHHVPGSVRQGLLWWQIDLSYLVLRVLAVFGVVWNLREPSAKVLAEARGSL